MRKADPTRINLAFNATTLAAMGYPGCDLHEGTESHGGKRSEIELSRVIGALGVTITLLLAAVEHGPRGKQRMMTIAKHLQYK